jgi:quinol monooxygenase YgiN
MITKWIQFTVASDSIDPFKAAVVVVERESKAEVGCVHYSAYQSVEQLDVFTVLESWESEEAFAAHREAVHLAEFKTNCGEMILSKSALELTPVSG